uniref:Uncharacterized protein n=1 Tax=Cacopsylla melanoneura TaxID=428564 RepID=A0A8D9E6B2_9HEMI
MFVRSLFFSFYLTCLLMVFLIEFFYAFFCVLFEFRQYRSEQLSRQFFRFFFTNFQCKRFFLNRISCGFDFLMQTFPCFFFVHFHYKFYRVKIIMIIITRNSL